MRHREKWRLALDCLDEFAGWGVRARPVVADAGYGDSAEFRQGLTDRGLVYTVGVTPTATAHPADAVLVTAQPRRARRGRRRGRRWAGSRRRRGATLRAGAIVMEWGDSGLHLPVCAMPRRLRSAEDWWKLRSEYGVGAVLPEADRVALYRRSLAAAISIPEPEMVVPTDMELATAVARCLAGLPSASDATPAPPG